MDGSQTFVPTCNALPLVAALHDRGYRFVAVTPATHHLVNARDANVWAARMEDVFGWSRKFAGNVLDPDVFAIAAEAGILEPVAGSPIPAWRSRLRAASLDGLLLLHSAFPTDAADAVFFGPDTYRFAAAVMAHLQGRRTIRRVIDIGCGTGAAGILIARAWPGAEVVLADISAAAVAVAVCNAEAAGVGNAACVLSDLFANVAGDFDLIVANPPYLNDPPRRLYRHGGGALGAALSLRITQESIRHLAPGGTLLLYTGSAIVSGRDTFFDAASGLLAGTGMSWHYREIDPDVFGEELRTPAYAAADRIAAVLLTVEGHA